jgi:hypothetical protein
MDPPATNPVPDPAIEIVINTSVALLGLIVVALVSLTGLIGVREGQPA